jgi:hypothetical protein
VKKEEVRARIEEVGIIPAVRVSSAEEACFAEETREWRYASFAILFVETLNPGPIRVQ